ncbi:hypothetical protein CA11_19840 [Gimesia maris]|uniref:hypothetical protein n=1 Tax=Gimesia maris TaxID=122 RepID=UPI00118BE8C5|nr:hypothetical protein [Gimesia maris]QDU14180.1 hypothetical protein CA11_19840 [Gimesia maris]
MVNQQKRYEFIEVYRQGAENWQSKGNLVRETQCLSSLLMNYLAIAVEKYDDNDEAKAWLITQEALPTLERYAQAMQLLVAKVDSGEVPASTIAGNYPHLVFTHLAWALGEFALGERFSGIASRSDVLELSTPFWQEFSRAVDTLVSGHQYTVGNLAIKGQEKYWRTYLQLIEVATNGQELSTAIAEIDDAFARRNLDKTIKGDAHEIEGSGGHPVQWDFRRDGLLNYIQGKHEDSKICQRLC